VKLPLNLSGVPPLLLQHPLQPVEPLEHVLLVWVLKHLADEIGDRLRAAQRQFRDDLNNALRTAGYCIPALRVADTANATVKGWPACPVIIAGDP